MSLENTENVVMPPRVPTLMEGDATGVENVPQSALPAAKCTCCVNRLVAPAAQVVRCRSRVGNDLHGEAQLAIVDAMNKPPPRQVAVHHIGPL